MSYTLCLGGLSFFLFIVLTVTGLFLMFYYVLVGALAIYLETTFQFSGSKANSVANWVWVVNAIALIGAGLASDRLRVRKPFMLFGAIAAGCDVALHCNDRLDEMQAVAAAVPNVTVAGLA